MLPTILFGLIGYGFIKMYFYHGLSIAVFLLFGSIIMFLAERFYTKSQKKFNSFYDLSYGSCFRIGLLQMFSLIPGVSRSATTIGGSFFAGLSREKAVLFSFFISIPISFCASIYDIYKNTSVLPETYRLAIFSFTITLLFSFCFVKKIIAILQKTSLNIFVYYRIILALLIFIYSHGVF